MIKDTCFLFSFKNYFAGCDAFSSSHFQSGINFMILFSCLAASEYPLFNIRFLYFWFIIFAMAEKKRISIGLIILIVILALIVLGFVSCTVSLFVDVVPSGNVALIPIEGQLVAGSADGILSSGVSSKDIVNLVEKADKNPSVKAIILEINSPGGSVIATKEIGDAVKRAHKPTYSLIREVGASGGYWIASATDKIIADELSVTGSIGVLSSYVEFAGLLERYNMTYQRLVSGKYKDMGSPFKEMTTDERELLMQKILKIHEYFIKEVAANRKLDVEHVRKLATGEFYLGSEALELGLIDALGNKQTVIEIIKKELNMTEVEIAEYRKTKTLKDIFSEVFSEQFFFIGRGIGSALVDARLSSRIDIIV